MPDCKDCGRNFISSHGKNYVRCEKCRADRCTYHRADRLKHRDHHYRQHIARQYRVSEADLKRIFTASQCDICAKFLEVGKRFHIDHSHTTGAFRGMLCAQCNTALGLFGDSVETMLHAIAYLRQHGE